MSNATATLPEDPAFLKAMIAALLADNAKMSATLQAHDELIQTLRLRIAKLKKEVFGKSSEKIEREIEQLELALEDLLIAAAEGNTSSIDEADETASVVPLADASEKIMRRRPRVSDTAVRERRELDPGSCCPECGGELRLVGEDASEILDMIAAQMKVPGYVEVDFVAHSGTSSSGSFVQTMVLTEIATGWTECVPVRTRESGNVVVAIKEARSRFPFRLLSVDFDNDSAFMNEFVVFWCRKEGLEVTRSRAYRKNDQAYVEQKNGAIVRRLVGYGRFVGAGVTTALGRLYAVVRLHGNLFQPSFKLREKTRIGARVIKRYHPPVPTAARALAHEGVAEADKKRLKTLMETTDPVVLFARIRAAQEELGKRVDQRGLSAKIEPPLIINLQVVSANLKTAWKNGETRPTHRRPYRRTKPWPKRPIT